MNKNVILKKLGISTLVLAFVFNVFSNIWHVNKIAMADSKEEMHYEMGVLHAQGGAWWDVLTNVCRNVWD